MLRKERFRVPDESSRMIRVAVLQAMLAASTSQLQSADFVSEIGGFAIVAFG